MDVVRGLLLKSGVQIREYNVFTRDAVEDMKDQLDQKIAKGDTQVSLNFNSDIPAGKMLRTELVDGEELELYVYVETNKEIEI